MLAPVNDVVIVLETPVRESASIFTPTSKNKLRRGTVVAVSNGYRNEEGVLVGPGVSVGEVVVYPPHSERRKEIINGVEHILLSSTSLLAVIEEPEL